MWRRSRLVGSVRCRVQIGALHLTFSPTFKQRCRVGRGLEVVKSWKNRFSAAGTMFVLLRVYKGPDGPGCELMA